MSERTERRLFEEFDKGGKAKNTGLESFDAFARRFRQYVADTEHWREHRKVAATQAGVDDQGHEDEES
jgi:hypothetical protein